ncbi:NAD(P)-binding protein [Pilatotrama ljubarskyi]|nr:NAD(P)-binding protein [Pilatotrama ljubarskyi]
MPIVTPPATLTVLVTGANGYLGLWIVRALLERGYSVRATVRGASAARTVTEVVERRLPAQSKNIKCVLVPDIALQGAFDDAVRDVDAIIHTASPVKFDEEDPEAYIKPAVDGTLSILRSALRHGRNVKRVVITSSIAAVMSTFAPPGVYSEEHWNEDAVRTVREQGRNAPGDIKYIASKALSEKAAWDFMNEHKDQASFDLCTILPSWTMGPPSDDPESPSAMSWAPGYLYSQVFAQPPPRTRDYPYFNYVDVHDAVELHVRALEVPAAGGQRFIASFCVCSWQDWLNAANDLGVLPGLDKGHPEATKDRGAQPVCSGAKATSVFGIKFRTVPETFKEVYEYFSARGWLRHLEG